MKSIFYSLVFFFGMYTYADISAQPFTLDESWDVGDYNAYNAKILGMLIQDDGKVVFWGLSTPVNWQAVARFYLESMQIDPDFRVQQQNAPPDIQRLPDGGYILNGNNWVAKTDENYYADTAYNSLFRETSQQPGTSTKNGGLRMFVYPDGRILAGCGFPCLGLWYKPNEHQSPFRILANGMVDSSFTTTSNGGISNISAYNDTQLIISGLFTEYEGFPSFGVARIDTSGALDSTFQSPFVMPTNAYTNPKGRLFDDKIIVTGALYLPDNDTVYSIVRLMHDGSIDPTFKKLPHNNGANAISSIHQTIDGGYIIAGLFSEIYGVHRGRIAKLDKYGNLEEEYFSGGGFTTSPEQPFNPMIHRFVYHEEKDHYYVTGFFHYYNGEPVPSVVRFRGLLSNTSEPENPIQSFALSPNPANESIHIQLPENILTQNDIQIEILNQLGQRVLYQTLGHQSVSISHLPAGMYFVQLHHQEFVFKPQKLVVF